MSNTNCTNVDSCYSCDSCDSCYSCRSCYSCSSCDSCRSCRSCRSCECVNFALFCHKIECKKDYLFNKQVTHERYIEVRNKYLELCGDWEPRRANGNELYKEAGCNWQEVDMNKFTAIGEVINYLKGLEEFNEKIFKEITGVDASKKEEELTIEEVCKELGRTIKIKKS